MKHNFKLKDIVFDIRYGWATISETMESYDDKIILSTKQPNDGRHPLIHDYYTDDMKFLSFEEYTLEGIIQEKPKEKFEINSLGYFWDNNYVNFSLYGKLTGINIKDNDYKYIHDNLCYQNFSLTPPDLKY